MSHLDNSYLQLSALKSTSTKPSAVVTVPTAIFVNLEPNSRDLVRAGPFSQLSKPCNIDIGHGAKKLQILDEALRVSQHCKLDSTTG